MFSKAFLSMPLPVVLVIVNDCVYEQVSVTSGVGRTGCWHEHQSLRKHGINLISKPIDKLYHMCAGKIFNFNFSCNVVVQMS